MSAVAEAGWPEVVWSAAILRGLDGRARVELEAAGRLRALSAKEVLYRPGDPADSIFVVAAGRVALTGVRRGEAEATVVRPVSCGEIFGEEATTFAFATRALEARAESEARVAEVPLVVLRRALGRTGGAEVASRLERALRRAATRDLLQTTSFTRELEERDLDALLDAAEHVRVARGEHVYRAGDPSEHAYLVAGGLVQIQTTDGARPRLEAYLGRGDLFGEAELEGGETRAASVVASGPTWLVAIPRAAFVAVARRAGVLPRPRVRVDAEALPSAAHTTAHVFRDLYRMRVARSLLVIDQDACIRCGHCAWSCADAHADGVARLVRRGDKMVVSLASEAVPLLVPNSCQHCQNPSCMIDCPTGAIGRDARGEVFIREDLCTGCGSCAKACPWDNIQMAARPADQGPHPEVAVKCDLCSGRPEGPACVAGCPAQAIARIDPNEVLPELGGSARTPALPPRVPTWPWNVAASSVALALVAFPLSPWTGGAIAGALALALVLYSGTKRSRRVRARLPASARSLYVAHVALGIVAVGAAAGHGGLRVPGHAAGALVLAFGAALASGLFGALASAIVPRRLSRIERESVLPEELAARRRELDDALYAKLTGRSDVVKALFARVLSPYLRARLGPLALAVSGRSLRAEQDRVRAQATALLGGRRSERLAGLEDLVRLAVEHRACRAQTWLTFVLRAWLGVHLAAVAAALVLLALHVALVTGAR
jgi:Fe-S-cluster-containing dehydrogenase component/CRP-like cAMP-binding protein